MISLFSKIFLDISDFFHKRKIITFLKKNIEQVNTFFDIGAHKGESINLFCENFKINNIYSFEPSPINFDYLNLQFPKIEKKFNKTKISIYNFAFGTSSKEVEIKQLLDSSSSTIVQIDKNSDYFKKKSKFLFNNNENYFEIKKTKQITLDEFIESKKILKIDLMKIDTEGYEYFVLLGGKKNIQRIDYILLEHHYHNMLRKNYTFNDINDYLVQNNFKKVFKAKMPFRKTFEYIYKNQTL
tara:strand:+ start:1788 stop:2510 length:723 start_codon:yes stop_codon:yes gene_type:complete